MVSTMASPSLSLGAAVRDDRLLGAMFAGEGGWWPEQLRLLDTLDGDIRRHFWSIGRQSGKDVMVAALAVHNAALRPDLDEVLPKGMWREILVCCPRQDQAEDFVATCGAHITNSPVLSKTAEMRSDRINFKVPRTDRHGRKFTAKVRILAIPANSHTTRGKRVSLLIFNEYAHADDTAGPAALSICGRL
ncbi:MAG: hypothetical protein JOZ81_12490 [Chloroflexi bacterium]|nr:hypothetical protein [Chloroflexota bacterium]